MPLKVDFQKCIKSGECYYNHPELFKMTESGFPAVQRKDLFTANETREAGEAAEVCPARAISFSED